MGKNEKRENLDNEIGQFFDTYGDIIKLAFLYSAFDELNGSIKGPEKLDDMLVNLQIDFMGLINEGIELVTKGDFIGRAILENISKDIMCGKIKMNNEINKESLENI